MKVFGLILLFLLVMFGMTWLVQGNEFFLTKFFSPKMEGVRREVFEQSKAYRQGTMQELGARYDEWLKIKRDHSITDHERFVSLSGLRSHVLHMMSDFPTEELGNHGREDLERWVHDLREFPVEEYSSPTSRPSRF
jgi:hypothetical protein